MQQFILFSREFKPLPGGVSEYVNNLAIYLQKNGALKCVFTQLKQEEFSEYKVEQSAIRHDRLLERRFGDKFAFLRKLNTLFHYLTVHVGAVLDVLALKFKAGDTRLIICAYYDYQTSFFIDWCLRLNLKYSLVLHGYDMIAHSVNGTHGFEKHCRKADLIIFNSNQTKKLYEKMFGTISNYYVLFPGLNIENIISIQKSENQGFTKKRREETRGKIIFSTVSRLVERKGIDIAIRAVAELYKIRQDILYYIGGVGAQYSKLNMLISELNAEGYIKLLGEISEVEKFELLESSKIYLLPTHTTLGNDFEGFGISFIEAEYMENIVFGGNMDGVVDAVKDGYSGFLMDFSKEGSHLALAKKLTEQLSDPEEMKKITGQAKSWVSDNFECGHLVKGIINYYQLK